MTALSFLMISVLSVGTAACFMLWLIFSFLLCATVFFRTLRHSEALLILNKTAYSYYYLLFLIAYERKFVHVNALAFFPYARNRKLRSFHRPK